MRLAIAAQSPVEGPSRRPNERKVTAISPPAEQPTQRCEARCSSHKSDLPASGHMWTKSRWRSVYGTRHTCGPHGTQPASQRTTGSGRHRSSPRRKEKKKHGETKNSEKRVEQQLRGTTYRHRETNYNLLLPKETLTISE